MLEGLKKKYDTESEAGTVNIQVMKAAKSVDGLWVGVDFIPAKNRDTDSPFFIEINSTPGTKGYVKATKTNLVKDVMTTFLNKDNWLKSKPFKSIYGDKLWV